MNKEDVKAGLLEAFLQLTHPQKLSVVSMMGALLAAGAFGGTLFTGYRVEKAEAEKARLANKIERLEEQDGPLKTEHISSIEKWVPPPDWIPPKDDPEEGIPDLEVARFDPRSMGDLRERFYELSKLFDPIATTLQGSRHDYHQDLLEEVKNRRFEWVAKVEDIVPYETENRTYLAVTVEWNLPPLFNPGSSPFNGIGETWYFDAETYFDQLSKVKRGDVITAVGVLTEDDNFVKCKLIDVPPNEP